MFTFERAAVQHRQAEIVALALASAGSCSPLRLAAAVFRYLICLRLWLILHAVAFLARPILKQQQQQQQQQ
jgi:hypothetical protein